MWMQIGTQVNTRTNQEFFTTMHNTPSMSSNDVDTRDNGDQRLQELIDSSLHQIPIYRIFTKQGWLVRSSINNKVKHLL
jgi:hypothetical protein